MTVPVDKPVNIRQLGRELAARQGHDDPLPVNARLDDETEEIVLVGAHVDAAELQEAVDAHEAEWPPPPPTRVDLLREAVKAMDEALGARPPPPDLVKVMRDHLVPILEQLDPILRDRNERRD